jgi:hypothetical protein
VVDEGYSQRPKARERASEGEEHTHTGGQNICEFRQKVVKKRLLLLHEDEGVAAT